MYRIKFVAMFLILGLVLSTNLSKIYAEEVSTSPMISVLDIPSSEISEADLEEFVRLALNEQITVIQTRDFYERLTDEQTEMVSDLVAINVGIPLDEWR